MTSLVASNLMKKNITHPAICSLTGTHKNRKFLSSFITIKPGDNIPAEISLKTRPAHESSMTQEVPTPINIPEFNPVPTEKPVNPPPLSPNPSPEFPGPPIPDPEIQPPGPDMPVPPNPDPEIQPPGPDMPVPPNTPGGPEVIPPRTPEWMPPNQPEVGPQRTTPPEISLPYSALV